MDFLGQFFTNPTFIFIAAGLISVPIIIHMINRLRFKRIAWAAMEFLLKAQKKNRRRLIIEQLLLLALRCLLVALVGLLVMRFVGYAGVASKGNQTLHFVLVDDTLSMNDQWKKDDAVRDCFMVAKEILVDKIARGIVQASSTDKLIVLQLSKVESGDKKEFDKLATAAKMDELKREVEQMEPTKMHLKLIDGVKWLKRLAGDDAASPVTLHILSDFRQKDWGKEEGAQLNQELAEFAKNRKAKIQLVDTADPDRRDRGGAIESHENVGIVDLKPSTRVVGKDMPVLFTVTLKNFSDRDTPVHITIYRDAEEQFQVDFSPPLPLKIPPRGQVQTTFEMRFSPQLKAGESKFARISAHLESAQRGPLEGDGLLQDNVAYTAVEVRDQVPVLIIDGEGKQSRQEERADKDSFYLNNALISVPGASYRVDYGDLLGSTGGVPTRALERPDLHNYPTIFLVNVRELTPKQLANLEAFVRDGGGLAFFAGPQISVPYYNKNLYKDGQGLFPAQIKDFYPTGDEMLKPEPSGAPMVLLRDDLFPSSDGYPIFGAVFNDVNRQALSYLPIKKYLQTIRKPNAPDVMELATLPNEKGITLFTTQVLDIARVQLPRLAETEEYTKYQPAFTRHRKILEKLVEPGSEKKPYFLAEALNNLLNEEGREKDRELYPNLKAFWSESDPKVKSLKTEIEALRDDARYGDPFVVARNFGKGKVVAVLTTAGRSWNDWAGGSFGTAIYQPFIWEMMNYLSSQNSDTSLMVGQPVRITVDTEPFKQQGGRRLKMMQTFFKTEPGKQAEKKDEKAKDDEKKEDKRNVIEDFGVEKGGVLTFTFARTYEPGVYVSQLVFEDAPEHTLTSWGHVFNVDAREEGPLDRVSLDDLKGSLISKGNGLINFVSSGSSDIGIERPSDLSESPLFFLFFLTILVAEQALAVHLSFHLKGSEAAPAAGAPRAAAA